MLQLHNSWNQYCADQGVELEVEAMSQYMKYSHEWKSYHQVGFQSFVHTLADIAGSKVRKV